MNAQWLSEQENENLWLGNSSASEPENVLDWLKNIGSGAAQGAGTGSVAGPWGTLIGGLVGAGLGAIQQATKKQPMPQKSAPPPSSTPNPAPTPPSTPSTSPTGGKSDTALHQFTQLLPQLVQLIQAIQPIVASAQQPSGRSKENFMEGSNTERLANSSTVDSELQNDQVLETLETRDEYEHIEIPPHLPETTETALPILSGNTQSPDLFATLTDLQPNLAFSGEWINESESDSIAQPSFHWAD